MLESIKYEGRAKNVIIFVGDGMGIQTHTMARIYKVTALIKPVWRINIIINININILHIQGQLRGETGEESQLAWETFPYSGLIKTYNTDRQAGDTLLLLH